MDLANLTPPAILVIGVFLIMLGTLGIEFGVGRKARQALKLVGVVIVAYAAMSLAGVSLIGPAEQPPAQTVGDEFTVTATESMSHLTVDNTGHIITWAVQYDYASQVFTSGTQYFQAIFEIEKGIGTVGLVQTSGDVTVIPDVMNETTGDSYPVLSKIGGDQYAALWTRADSTFAYETITVTLGEAVNGVALTLNMSLNSGAIGSMSQFESKTVIVSVGGVDWQVQVLLAAVT